MNIIIAGAGKVGFNLAKTLSIGHNVIIIDKNKEALDRISESLDILPYFGDIKDPRTYENFEQTPIDLFIAVTNLDEANIISSLVVEDILDIGKKFVRLQNEYYEHSNIKEKLNIYKLIFPSKISSNNITALLKYPKINNIKNFKYTDYKVVSIFCAKDKIEDEELEFIKDHIIGIEKNGTFSINNTDDIQKGDLIYVITQEEDIPKICDIFDGDSLDEIKNCVIFGGSELGINIAKILVENKKDVKLIEKDINLCNKAEEVLEGKVHIINSKYQNEELFIDENLDKADICISTYKDDEYNIIKCIEAKEFGIPKVVAINNESEYYNLMHRVGIIALRGEKISAYHTIIEHINNSKIILEKFFCGGKGVVFLRKIFENSKLIGKNLSNPSIPESRFYLIRGEKMELLDEIVLEENDIVIAITLTENMPKVKTWIYEL